MTGAALLMRWTLLGEVGPWDESFLLYSEETEYMLRAADRGWSTWYVPDALIEHGGLKSATQPGLAALLTVNKVRLFRERHGRVAGWVYAVGLSLGVAASGPVARRAAWSSLVALLVPSRRITALSQLR